MSYEPKHLKRWTLPNYYVGKLWPNYYSSGFGRSRDSDYLEESNFVTALKAIGGESETVTVVRESHWAVGWVEWIAIHQDDEAALRTADELRERYNDYPVLDENDFSEREWEGAQSCWTNLPLRERVDLCRDEGLSIFAARHDWIPEGDSGRIFEYCRGY